MIKNIEWIDINEQLPPDNDWRKEYLVTVNCELWGDKKYKTMTMDWECTTVRSKETKRWLWNDKIKDAAWVVTHWAKLPEPAVTESNENLN